MQIIQKCIITLLQNIEYLKNDLKSFCSCLKFWHTVNPEHAGDSKKQADDVTSSYPIISKLQKLCGNEKLNSERLHHKNASLWVIIKAVGTCLPAPRHMQCKIWMLGLCNTEEKINLFKLFKQTIWKSWTKHNNRFSQPHYLEDVGVKIGVGIVGGNKRIKISNITNGLCRDGRLGGFRAVGFCNMNATQALW